MCPRLFERNATWAALVLTILIAGYVSSNSAFGAQEGAVATTAPRYVVLSNTQVLVQSACDGLTVSNISVSSQQNGQAGEQFSATLIGLGEAGIQPGQLGYDQKSGH
jgi:hypothetical protein